MAKKIRFKCIINIMDNPLYNSLTEKLIQNGILPSDSSTVSKQSSNENFFEKEYKPDNENNGQEEIKKNKKRLNHFELDLIENSENVTIPNENKNPYESIKRFLNFEQIKLEKGNAAISEILFSRFFPKVYKAKLVKQAMTKFFELNIDTQTLLNKTIPYGENETRYEDLIKYLNYANELQTRLKKKLN